METVNMDWFNETVDQLKKTQTMENIKDLLTKQYKFLGCDYWLASIQISDSLLEPSVIIINNYPDDFWLEYINSNWIIHDPISQYCLTRDIPRVWTLEGWGDLAGHKWKEDVEHYGPETHEYFNFLRSTFGEKCGLVLPLHTSDGSRGCSKLSFNMSYKKARPYIEQALLFVPALLPHIYVAMQKTLAIKPHRLTEREKEALFWVGEGKKTAEVASLLNIKPRTVESHITSVQLKLDVSNRQEAITKAVNLGIIVPVGHCANLVLTMSESQAASGPRQIHNRYTIPYSELVVPRRIGMISGLSNLKCFSKSYR